MPFAGIVPVKTYAVPSQSSLSYQPANVKFVGTPSGLVRDVYKRQGRFSPLAAVAVVRYIVLVRGLLIHCYVSLVALNFRVVLIPALERVRIPVSYTHLAGSRF